MLYTKKLKNNKSYGKMTLPLNENVQFQWNSPYKRRVSRLNCICLLTIIGSFTFYSHLVQLMFHFVVILHPISPN